MTLWDSKKISVSSIVKGDRWIGTICTILHSGVDCCIYNVYLHTESSLRSTDFTQLSLSLLSLSSPALLVEDFNEILHTEERKNCPSLTPSMYIFQNFVSSNSLVKLPLQGKKFTWTNSLSASRVDRVFAHSEWLLKFPHLLLTALSKSLSDHTPFLLHQSEINWGPKPFRTWDC